MSVRKSGEYLGLDTFVFFFGVVEDVNDPLKTGRVRVRCYNWHTPNKTMIPTDGLPWAQVVTPVTNTAMGNIGHTPVGLVVGTTVFGFFADGKSAQIPIIIGSLPGISPDIGEPDMNRLARAEGTHIHGIVEKKNAGTTSGISGAGGVSWSEPKSSWAAKYPFNYVFESRGGHILEVDDTEGAKRIHQYHASGTFQEIDNAGNVVVRVVKDKYEIIAGTDYIHIKGDANLTVNGNLNLKSSNMNIETGALSIKSGSTNVQTGGYTQSASSTSFDTGSFDVQTGGISSNQPWPTAKYADVAGQANDN